MGKLCALLLGLGLVVPAFAQSAYVAVSCEEDPPTLDGRLDDRCWGRCPPGGGLVQFEPEEGRSSREKTVFYVAYTLRDVFVGVRADDSSPQGPALYQARRDAEVASDWISLWFDSLGDKRTAFYFAVNPSGVKRDAVQGNGTDDEANRDLNWDPVWDVAVHAGRGYWSAEFRIPLSQLRFPVRDRQRWGFELERQIVGLRERSYWAPVAKGAPEFVPLFGTLEIPEALPAPRRFQVVPFAVGKFTSQPASADPFVKTAELTANAGLDAKYGLSSNFTLDLTVNPDFGQVEADPAQVNLSAYETYLTEKRPFFVEGAGIFRFGQGSGGNGDSLFYSRRIGHVPSGWPTGAAYADVPGQTPIAAALKLSGKTRSGFSLGILEAVTPAVNAPYLRSDLTAGRAEVEPLTSFTLVRAEQALNQGRSAIGGIFTWTQRDLRTADLEFLNRKALAGGIDFRHRWNGDRYEVAGYVVGSRIEGSRQAIQRAQESSARYYQRPDNTQVRYDPTRTSLSGMAFQFSLGKVGGGHWRWSLSSVGKSPGYEVNDLGYMMESDQWQNSLTVSYLEFRPRGMLREFEVSGSVDNFNTFQPMFQGTGGSLGAEFRLMNYWGVEAQLRRQNAFLSVSTLRGGPAVWAPGENSFALEVETDSRRKVYFNAEGGWEWGDEGKREFQLDAFVRAKALENLDVQVGPSYVDSHNPLQFVEVAQGATPHYVFGTIDQQTLGLTVRLNLALRSGLTLQLYSQPFIASGSYGSFKEVSETPRDHRFSARWHEFLPGEIVRTGTDYTVSRGEGRPPFRFGDPDFHVQKFNLNVVLRWEYRPGSTLFLVWTQGREDLARIARFEPWRNLRDLFRSAPTDVVMLKWTYWLEM